MRLDDAEGRSEKAPGQQPKHMEFETVNLEEITEARRKAVAASIRTISLEELKALGQQLFPYAGDVWGEKFFAFLDGNPGSTFHHATSHDGVQFLFCNAQDKGIWFMPKKGMGPMQPRGRAIFKQIVEGH
jgi:hypothetical protein